jgi:hypothetical protein
LARLGFPLIPSCSCQSSFELSQICPLEALVEQIASRIGRALERRGLVERDMENAWPTREGEGGPLDDLLGSSITYRFAVGSRSGQKLFTLQAVPPRVQGLEGDANGAARAGGFSLHDGIEIATSARSSNACVAT